VKAQRASEAIARYREILEIDPANGLALGALDGLYEGQQMWAELADNVSRRLDLAEDPEEQTSHMLRLALLREQRMVQSRLPSRSIASALARPVESRCARCARAAHAAPSTSSPLRRCSSLSTETPASTRS